MAERLLKELLEVDIVGDFRDYFAINFQVGVFVFCLLIFIFYFYKNIFLTFTI